jgi:hypothetical protein
VVIKKGKTRETLVEDELWKNSFEEDIDVAIWTLERHLLPQIYNLYIKKVLFLVLIFFSTFSVLEEDLEFGESVKFRAPTLTVQHLLIPDKYHVQAPWELAQRGRNFLGIFRS